MLYPQGGTAQMDSAAPNLSNPISSLGAPESVQQQPNPSTNKAQELIDSFGTTFQQFNSLAMQYPVAMPEFNEVVESLKKWLAKASDSIVSEGGINSAPIG